MSTALLMTLDLAIGDRIVGVTAYRDHLIAVSERGKVYRIVL
jgi:hypothetical protein